LRTLPFQNNKICNQRFSFFQDDRFQSTTRIAACRAYDESQKISYKPEPKHHKVTNTLFATHDHHEKGDAQSQEGRVGTWFAPALIQPNNFVYKSLSCWSFNIAIGCSHACRFCYVPSAATIKQGQNLARYGVKDPDLEWGQYVLLRPWDEKKFLASLR